MSLAVGDFLAIGQLAWVLYRDCIAIARGAPQEFKLLVEELKTLHMMMKSFDEEFNNPDSVLVRSGEDRQKMIGEILARLNDTLNILNDIFRKHRNLGSTVRSGVKRTWDKFKWTWDAKEVDGLRSKLSYHNGILGLLLACAGNSSLQRIENTTRSIDNGLQQLNTYLRRAATGTIQPTPSAPLVSVDTLDHSARLDFSAQCMKAAEISQRWLAIGIDDWIKAGRWWLLRANAELQSPLSTANGEVSKEGYLNLLKASWILTDVIALHPQFGLIESSIQYEVMQLTQAINQEFKRMEVLNANLPALSTMNEVVIWEGYTQSPTPKLDPQRQEGRPRNWIMEDEMIVYQNFGNYQPHDHTTPLTVCISVVVNLISNQARLVFHDQSWRLLFKIQVSNLFAPNTNRINVESTTISIGKQKVVVPAIRDAAILHATLVLYGKYSPILMGLPDPILLYHDAFIFLIALKMNETEDPTMLRHLAQMKLHQQLRGDAQHETNPFLRQFGMMVTRLGFETHEAARSNEPCGKGERFQQYAYSLLGWVLSQHFDVGREWVHVHVHPKGQRLNTEPPEDLLLPEIAVTQGNRKLFKLWLDAGLDPSKEHDLVLSVIRGGNLVIFEILLEYGVSLNDPLGATDMALVHHAAREGQEAMIAMLIEWGARIECQDKDRATPLHLAAHHAHEGVVRLLLDRGAEIECQNSVRWRPLHWAAHNGHVGVVKLLLDRGAEIECQDSDQATPLHLAAQNGHVGVVRLLLDRGAEIECQNSVRWRPLHWAAHNGHVGAVKLLLDRGAEIECQDSDQGRPLHAASKNGHEAVVKLLLDRGAETECQGSNQAMPLHLAAENGHVGVARLLLDRGAGIECQDSGQCRPLHRAARYGYEGIVRLLLDCGAEIECQDSDQCRPLHWAARNGHENIVRLLLDRGAEIECQKSREWRPLLHAAHYGYEGIVRLLLDRGAEIECQDSDEWGPLLHAAVNGHEDIVRLLLDRGAEIECKKSREWRPLHLAANNGHAGVVRLLLDRGAEIECQDSDKRRPLHFAANNGHAGVVRLLLDRRAVINPLNDEGLTPLQVAKFRSNRLVIDLLEERIGQRDDK